MYNFILYGTERCRLQLAVWSGVATTDTPPTTKKCIAARWYPSQTLMTEHLAPLRGYGQRNKDLT